MLSILILGCSGPSHDTASRSLPENIQGIINKPLYSQATWGLRVIDVDTGELIYALQSEQPLLIGSVRKLFSVGLTLDTLGSNHTFRTPVHWQGTLDKGVLAGNLILVASGDMAMGGRTNPDGSFSSSNLDHNEANSLGNAELTASDPLAGYQALANQVQAAGITQIVGEVIIDDRLFDPFNFRDEFKISPIFVNDNVVDVIINRGSSAQFAEVDIRPKSAAFTFQSSVKIGVAGTPFTLELEPEFPSCIGQPSCTGRVTGTLPADFVPPLNGTFPLIRTFRIVEPANYARTVFIEALQRAGISVNAVQTAANPFWDLPARDSFTDQNRLAQLISLPFEAYAKHILKVSDNIGAETSLMHLGLATGVRTISDARKAEQKILIDKFGIAASQFHFVDGSGGGPTAATGKAITTLLAAMRQRPHFLAYRDALPQLGIDGSLAIIQQFARDPALAEAKGKVHAKTGTFIEAGAAAELMVRAQALAGYIDAKSGRRLAYSLTVNNVGPIRDITELLPIIEDQGTISALLWKEL